MFFRKPLWFNRLVWLPVSMIGLLIPLGIGTYLIAKEQACKSWPTAEAEITDVVRVPGADEWSHQTAKFNYTYVVDSQTYYGDRVCFGPDNDHASRSRTNRWLMRYPEGEKTTVHYNPKNPNIAVLDPDDHGMGMFFVILGVVVWPIGYVLTGIKMSLIWLVFGHGVRQRSRQARPRPVQRPAYQPYVGNSRYRR